MDVERYLARVGLAPGDVRPFDADALARLQTAHVTAVPFETLAITGDPHGERGGGGVSLAPADCYAKVVARRRGGFCYELNGAFGPLLDALGVDVTRVAARVVDDGELTPPASHMAHVAALDREYVVDVGLGVPTMRRPTPLDGRVVTDAAGVDWRAVESDRPDADHCVQLRDPDEEDWRDRYIFTRAGRATDYFAATCDHLTTAPESGFTGDPTVSIATERGHKWLGDGTLTEQRRGETVREESVNPAEWTAVLESEFGVRWPPEG
ncbi:arylamine N-acetyltransferase family protein [Haloarcula litorea]|uniref:arylamine N-acetyltransferase family protein n=1 Tax=Haloarcula litorea TaxID=3032579 RepID=UPI0023E7DDE2|nr:arylamine N-acetyltransferase [Halomicroarcula sp. GDY20]